MQISCENRFEKYAMYFGPPEAPKPTLGGKHFPEELIFMFLESVELGDKPVDSSDRK